MPAPCGSIATCGTPSGSPAPLIGWQMTSRHPSKLGCFRVATTLPSTRAKYILVNAEIVHHHATTHTGERARVGDTFAGWRGNRVAQVTFAAEAEASHARAVFHIERGVQRAAHCGDGFDIVRVND